MRRRLSLLVLAVTSLVVVAYTVPLGLQVRTQAEERARTDAEQLAQSVAATIVALVARTGVVDMATIATSISLPDGATVLGSDGAAVGSAEFDRDFAASTVAAQRSLSKPMADGRWQVSLPVIGGESWAVVSVVVPRSELTRGVTRAWIFLGLLGLVLMAVASLLADRLGRTLRKPVEQLAEAAHLIGLGNLDTRVERPEIPELSAVADALNQLAPQLRNLLISEREALADLSHRLRTPLAALRLQTEALSGASERTDMLALVDRMQASVDRLIMDARTVDSSASCDLAAVAQQHATFWSVLAEEESRAFEWTIPDQPVKVAVSAEELGDVVDVLIGNVFSHTDRGVPFVLEVNVNGDSAHLVLTDGGDGFPTDIDPLSRGVGTGGSSGLGLDIARRLAERAGGTIELCSGADGGAQVVLAFPVAQEI